MPTLVRVLLLSAFVTIALCPARADDAELVRERLFQAKKEYDAESRKFRAAVGEALDKREEDARKAGNKKAVDQVKVERDRFEKTGEPPAMTPLAQLTQIRAARTNLNKAYATAIKDYVRLKEDAAAEAAEQEQQKFAFESALQFVKPTLPRDPQALRRDCASQRANQVLHDQRHTGRDGSEAQNERGIRTEQHLHSPGQQEHVTGPLPVGR